MSTHLETREEGIYVVIAGLCGSADNVRYTKTDEVKIATGQLPSGYFPAIYEKLLFAIVYIILVPIWWFFMKEALAKPYYKLILALILCCCAGCVCSFVSLLLSNQSGQLRSPINLILDVLVILLRSVGNCIVLLLACGFALSLFVDRAESESFRGSRSAQWAVDASASPCFTQSPMYSACFCFLPLC